MTQQQDLSRFHEAHRLSYAAALEEIRGGRKRTHWMWYIFPQIRGLGRSPTAEYYAIRDRAEAEAFLRDPVLGGHLTEISLALLDLEDNDAAMVFDFPDNLKLRSSMTLFAAVAGESSVFQRVLDKFFFGEPDARTLCFLRERS